MLRECIVGSMYTVFELPYRSSCSTDQPAIMKDRWDLSRNDTTKFVNSWLSRRLCDTAHTEAINEALLVTPASAVIVMKRLLSFPSDECQSSLHRQSIYNGKSIPRPLILPPFRYLTQAENTAVAAAQIRYQEPVSDPPFEKIRSAHRPSSARL